MELTRRDFFKVTAAGSAGAAWATFGFDLEPAYAQVGELKISRANEIRSVCPYCGVGCSMIAYVSGHGETTSFNTSPPPRPHRRRPGQPDQRRLAVPQGREHHAARGEREASAFSHVSSAGRGQEWEDISWEEALDRLARLMKDARDRALRPQGRQGTRVNRNEGFAWSGGATISNEEGYLTTKVFRALGDGGNRATGPGLTRPHGGQFGRLVWPGGHDQSLGRLQELGCIPGYRRQSGGESSLRVEVGACRARHTRRQDHSRGSSLHTHFCGGGPLGAHSRGNRCHLLQGASSTMCLRTSSTTRIT